MTQMERTTMYNDLILPEMAVAAVWVTVMKMAYGLDGQERSVSSLNNDIQALKSSKSRAASD